MIAVHCPPWKRRPSVLQSKTLKRAGFAWPFESNAGSPCGFAAWGTGDLDGFINVYLTQQATGELKK
jgi:hypothetical protein